MQNINTSSLIVCGAFFGGLARFVSEKDKMRKIIEKIFGEQPTEERAIPIPTNYRERNI